MARERPGWWGLVYVPDVVDLLEELGPGDHEVVQIYNRYLDLAESRGRIAASPIAFGNALSRLGLQRRTMWSSSEMNIKLARKTHG